MKKYLRTYESFNPKEEWEEEYDEDQIEEVDPEFNKFLIENGVKDSYIKNFDKKFDGVQDLDTNEIKHFLLRLKEFNRTSYIFVAFNWSGTPERHEFWSIIDSRWRTKLRLNESFNPEEHWEEEYEEEWFQLSKHTRIEDFPFKEGDHVRINTNKSFGGNNNLYEGDGIIKRITLNDNGTINEIGICFDNNIDGHDLYDFDKDVSDCEEYNGWYIMMIYHLRIKIKHI